MAIKKRKAKRGSSPDPSWATQGSVRFGKWVDRVGVQEAAEAIDCARQTIWHYRIGKYRPSWERMIAINELCRIAPEAWRRPA